MPHPFTKERRVLEAIEPEQFATPEAYEPEAGLGISRYRAHLGNNAHLETLLINQGSDTLFVSCHGALRRKDFVLPRFERVRTLQNTAYSSMFFGDPTLYSSEALGLGWYTGWKDLDMYPIMADWVKKTAAAIGAQKIVFLGSSGGGYAAMQLSAYIPNSVAVPLSPQSRIDRYAPSGSLGYQRNYVKHVMPHLLPHGGASQLGMDSGWAEPLGVRASVIKRYSCPQMNFVLYVQNANDKHMYTDHYLPFREALQASPNNNRVRFFIYDGPPRHTSPTPEMTQEIIEQAVAWATQIQEDSVGSCPRGFVWTSEPQTAPEGYQQHPEIPNLLVHPWTLTEVAQDAQNGFVAIIGTCIPTFHGNAPVAEMLLSLGLSRRGREKVLNARGCRSDKGR